MAPSARPQDLVSLCLCNQGNHDPFCVTLKSSYYLTNVCLAKTRCVLIGRKEAWPRAQCETFYSASQDSTTCWSDVEHVKGKARLNSYVSVSTLSLRSISQHSTTWWSDGKTVSEQGGPVNSVPRAVRWREKRKKKKNVSEQGGPVSSVPRGGQMEKPSVSKEDQSTQYHVVVRWKKPVSEQGGPVNSVPRAVRWKNKTKTKKRQ